MAQTVCVLVSTPDRQRLEAVALDRNRQRKHIERRQVVPASVDGGPVQQIALRLGVSGAMVWRWQQRFAEEGVDGVLRDRTRKPGKPPIAAETVARVVALTRADPPHKATHTTTLFAALNVLDGLVIGRRMQRSENQFSRWAAQVAGNWPRMSAMAKVDSRDSRSAF
jgi:transposase